MTKRLLTLFGIIACWISALHMKGQTACALNGTYTINASQATGGTNFASFTAAATELNNCGVTGPVILNVVSGTYTEHIIINDIAGASAQNTIAIQAAPSNTSPVNMSYGATGAANNYVIRLSGTEYVTISGLNIKATGNTYGKVIDFSGVNAYVTIENNTLTGIPLATGGSPDKGVIVNGASSNQANYCTIRNNIVKNGNWGIYWLGGGSFAYEKGHVIKDNLIEGSSNRAIDIEFQDSILVEGNEVLATSVIAIGIRASQVSRIKLSANQINVATGVAMDLNRLTASPAERNLVANNMISVQGVRVTNSILTDIVFNSLYVSNESAIEFGAGNGQLRVLNNNIFHRGTQGAVVKIAGKGAFTSMNYNNLYASNGADIGDVDNVPAPNIFAWRALSDLDTNSLNKDPGYLGHDDLHISSSSLLGKGISFPSVQEDIDGDIRIGTRPTIGADEILTVSGDCEFFTSFYIDSLMGESFKVNWTPGNNSSSFYFEYGAEGFTPGSVAGTKIIGAYPGGGQPPLYISGLSPNTAYDIYFGEICNSGNDTSSIEKLTLHTTTLCPDVESVSVDTVVGNSATFTLNSFSDQFEIEWGLTGYGQGTGTISTYGNPATITGLLPLTSYDFYIRSDCASDSDGISPFFGPVTITTKCENTLSGTYTIGGSTGPRNFVNLQEAVDELNTCGISGAVNLDLAQGTHEGAYILNNIEGVSAVNTITIRPDPSNTQAVVLVYNTSVDTNYVIQLKDMSHTSIEGITVRTGATTGNYRRVIEFTGSGSNINLKNNTFEGVDTISGNPSGYNQAVLFMGTDARYDHCLIRGNTISGGSYGIGIQSSVANTGYGNIIDNNSITGWLAMSIISTNQDSIIIRKNTMKSYDYPVAFCKGIALNGGDYFDISENNILLSAVTASSFQVVGIDISNYTSSESEACLLSNNMLMVDESFSPFSGAGINIANSGKLDIFHNSVSNGMSARPTLALGNGNTDNIAIYNNILMSGNGAPVIVVNSGITGSVSGMDYNNLFTTGATLGNWGGVSTSDLSGWQTASSMDSNSFSVNPLFVSGIDLHVLSPVINDVAKPLDRVSVDIDGEARSATNPDIGADEYTPPPCDPSSNIGAFQIYSDSIGIYWEPGDGEDYYIEYDTAGFTRGEGNFISGITDTFYTATGLIPQATYDFYLRDYCGISDTSVWVGPFTFTTPCADADLMSGTYTIDLNAATGGTNFNSFSEAIADLNECGVKGPVVFNVAEGDYYEQIILENIYGASTVNTITFQPDPANTQAAELKNFYVTLDSNYIIRFRGSRYIIIKGLTIYNGTTSNPSPYGRVLEFTGYCSDILIENNTIGSFATSFSNFNMSLIMNGSSTEDQVNNITIRNNLLQNGSYAINWSGLGSSNTESGNIFEGNTIEGYAAYGMRISNQNDLLIRGNIMKSADRLNIVHGIYLSGGNNFNLSSNKIMAGGRVSTYGIRIENAQAFPGDTNFMRNNMVSLSGSSTTASYGLYVDNSSHLDIIHNSVLGTSGGTGGRCLYVSGLATNKVNVFNNNFVHTGGYAIQVSPGIPELNMNYNNLYASHSGIGVWNNIPVDNLLNWKMVTSMDSNSISFDPFYLAPDSLYASSPLINNKGISYPSVNADIDGVLRSATPDIGANEFDPLTKDIFVTGIMEPLDSSCGDSNSIVSIIIGNKGLDNATNFDISVEVDGAVSTVLTHTYSGTLTSGKTDTLTLSSFNSSVGGEFDLKAFVNLTGDLNRNNDTLHRTIHIRESLILNPSSAIGHFCTGDYDTLFFPSGLEGNFNWKTTDGITIGNKDSLVVGPLGSSDTTFTLSSSWGCFAGEGSITLQYIIPENIPAPLAVTDSFCTEDFVTLYLPGDFTGDFYWKTTDGTIVGDTDTLIVGPLAGNDTTFTVSSANGCFTGNHSISLYRKPAVEADFNYTEQPPTMTDRVVNFDAAPSTGSSTWEWDLGDGNFASGSAVSHSYTSNGSYNVQLIVIGDCGGDTLVKEVNIEGIDLNENIIDRSLEIFPNPVKDKVQLSFKTENSGSITIRLIDLSGKLILQRTIANTNGDYKGEIDMSYFSKGTYLLQVESRSAKAVRRVIKN